MKLFKICLLINILIIFSGCALIRKTYLHQNLKKISGKLETDTLWDGLIEVEDKIVIPEGITLTIKAGAIIRFQKNGFKQFGFGDNRIYVQKGGKLIASGNSDNFIIFTSAENKPRTGDWHGIEFHTEDNLSVLNYCKIEYAYEAVACILSSPNISNNLITKNNKGICLWQRSAPEISGNKITGNKTGILSSSKCSPNIILNLISDNNDSGINCEKGSSANIYGNKIINCDYGIQTSMDVSVNIDNNTIRKNNYGIYQLNVSSLIVTRNIIEENKYGIYSLRKSVMNVNNNSINKNEYGIYSIERTKGEIKNNKITKNKFGIYCGKTSDPDITNNNIHGNKAGIVCEYSSYPKINCNNIHGQSGYDIILGENQSFEWSKKIWPKEEAEECEKNNDCGFINAAGNYWGGSTTAEMDKKGFASNIKMIYDYYDKKYCNIKEEDYTRDKVDFRNWEKNEIK